MAARQTHIDSPITTVEYIQTHVATKTSCKNHLGGGCAGNSMDVESGRARRGGGGGGVHHGRGDEEGDG
eukprot:8392251-Pyramimonas_sp.AAC.1